MQQAFCTNCGKPLTPGAAFCASCGTPVEGPPAASAAPTAFQSGGPGYTPGYIPSATPAYNSPASFTPAGPSVPVASPPPAPKSQIKTLALWLGGCLVAALIVVALLIVALIYGITTHHLVFFFIGLIGLVVILLAAAAVEHIIRRLIWRARGGLETLERDVLGGPGVGPRRYRGGARPYRAQPSFSPIRFLFTLVILGALLYGGAFLYYTQQFSGEWTGTFKIGGAAPQGVLVPQFSTSLSLHFSSWPNITEVDFKPATAQACKNSQSYTLSSGTATMLDASQVALTLTVGSTTIPLTGTYQNGTFMLSGTSGGKPVTLILQKGSDQQDYVKICG